MVRSVSRQALSFSRAFKWTLLSLAAVTLLGAIGYYLVTGTRPNHTARHAGQLDSIKWQARDLTVQIRVYHKKENWGASATGVIVRPGRNGKGRVLTNGHVCDAVSIAPDPLGKLAEMTKEQSLFLPIEGVAILENNLQYMLNKILAHSDWPDLCVIELATALPTKDYASLADKMPDYDEMLMTVGYPGAVIKLVQTGASQGMVIAGFPPRRLNPDYFVQYKEWREKRLTLVEMARRTQFAIDYVIVHEKPSPDKTTAVDRLYLRLKAINDLIGMVDAQLKIIDRAASAPSLVLNVWAMGGASGSGVWNADGKIVAILWGGLSSNSGQLAFCVGLSDVQKFMKTLSE